MIIRNVGFMLIVPHRPVFQRECVQSNWVTCDLTTMLTLPIWNLCDVCVCVYACSVSDMTYYTTIIGYQNLNPELFRPMRARLDKLGDPWWANSINRTKVITVVQTCRSFPSSLGARLKTRWTGCRLNSIQQSTPSKGLCQKHSQPFGIIMEIVTHLLTLAFAIFIFIRILPGVLLWQAKTYIYLKGTLQSANLHYFGKCTVYIFSFI